LTFILKQFDFETPLPRLTAKASFAYACGTDGGASRLRRLSIFNFEML
jgi:hypothetical protein